jgi:hypothetical protein
MATSSTLRITAAEQRRRLHETAEELKHRVRRTLPDYVISGIVVLTTVLGFAIGYRLIAARKR